MSGHVVSKTLTALPVKVASAGGSPRRCGLRNLSSSITTGNNVSKTRHAVFHIFGGLPVAGSLGTQPGNDVSTRCALKRSTKGEASSINAARCGEFCHALKCCAVSNRSTVVQPVSLCWGGWTNDPM